MKCSAQTAKTNISGTQEKTVCMIPLGGLAFSFVIVPYIQFALPYVGRNFSFTYSRLD